MARIGAEGDETGLDLGESGKVRVLEGEGHEQPQGDAGNWQKR